MQLDNGL